LKKLILYITFFILFCSCGQILRTGNVNFEKREYGKFFIDERDNTAYGIVEIGEQTWFAENLKFKSPKSICYKKKESNCNIYGNPYPYDELEIVCPKGWRVPKINDWKALKSNFENDSIYALLDTINWEVSEKHSNKSGVSIQGAGYQMKKNYLLGTEEQQPCG